ncbi:MAG TPA: BamA/TamA family outer membrane protein [Longimicrobiales bacterium]
MFRNVAIAAILAAAPVALSAQSTDSYDDPGAATLLQRARTFRDTTDNSILSYTATVRSRMGARLRMPLKDRTLYRAESAVRVRWSRDAKSVKQVLAHREQTPAGIEPASSAVSLGSDEMFDPAADRITLGLGRNEGDSEEVWIEHPVANGAEAHYRYASGDTMTIRLQDGRVIRSIELRVIPRVPSGHVVAGSLWIDPSNGAVVQAVYRLARPLDIGTEVIDEDDAGALDKVPGMFKPMEFDLNLVAIEYSLHEMRYWLPNSTRIEGYLRAGVVRVPAVYEISYDIEQLVFAEPATVAAEAAAADSVAREWSAGHYIAASASTDSVITQVVLLPDDTASLRTSAELPEPAWEYSPTFATDAELEDLYKRVERIPGVVRTRPGVDFEWGYGGTGLLRYNRVEALSLGARVTAGLPQVALSATARLGVADLVPNIAISALRSTPRRNLELDVRYALAAVDDQSDAFGMGNSASALLLGRDAGEYYRTARAALSLRPPEHRQASYDLTFFAQHDDAVERETNATVRRLWNGDFRFRPNIDAAETELYGAALRYRPWWGADAFRWQGGLDLMVEGVTGGYRFARTTLTARTAVPLGDRHRIALEVGGGTAEGDVPPQRMFYLGGAPTLRGYDPSTFRGTSFARARAEAARTFGWGATTLFSDAAWAGERDDYDPDSILYSVGAGFSVLDGLLRFDLAHALREVPGQSRWRIELYLDALL